MKFETSLTSQLLYDAQARLYYCITVKASAFSVSVKIRVCSLQKITPIPLV